ncbi:hypothetical protein B0H13DRAFT_2272616 [Mycena leptocephala]|nr:hypothetical protein B0H13DRAFT_2272616 [Mycena leptocephala]
MALTVAKMRHVRARIRELHYVAPRPVHRLPKSKSTRTPPPPESIPAPARASVPPLSARLPSHPHPQQQQYAPQYGGYPGGPAPPSIRAPGLCPSYQPGIPAPAPAPDRPTNAQVAMSRQEKPGQQWRHSASPAPSPPHSHALLQSGPPALSLAIGGEEGLGINFEFGTPTVGEGGGDREWGCEWEWDRGGRGGGRRERVVLGEMCIRICLSHPLPRAGALVLWCPVSITCTASHRGHATYPSPPTSFVMHLASFVSLRLGEAEARLEGGASLDGGGEARRGAGWGTSGERRVGVPSSARTMCGGRASILSATHVQAIDDERALGTRRRANLAGRAECSPRSVVPLKTQDAGPLGVRCLALALKDEMHVLSQVYAVYAMTAVGSQRYSVSGEEARFWLWLWIACSKCGPANGLHFGFLALGLGIGQDGTGGGRSPAEGGVVSISGPRFSQSTPP